jgi:hypothetical protein
LTIGARGELPQGLPISYRLQVTEGANALATAAAVRVNGFRRDVAIAASDAIKVSVSLRAAALAGQAGDWWLVARTADGQFYHFDLPTMSWQPGLLATHTGALGDLPYFGLPTLAGLPAGRYDFYFGVDTVPNGALDFGSLVYEQTVLTVRP